MYADNTVISRCDSDIDGNHRNMQGDLNRLYKWCKSNGLTINSRKTKVVNFGQSKKVVKDLHISKEILAHEKQYKYLGVILDSKLNFEPQYKELVTRNAVVAAGKKAILAIFPAATTAFLALEGQSVVILNNLEISPSLFNHHYGFQ